MRKTRLQCTCHLLSISQLLASCISYLMYAFSMEVATLGYKALLPICYNMVVACSSTKLISQNSSGTFRKDSKGEKTLSIVPVKQLQFLSSKQMTRLPLQSTPGSRSLSSTTMESKPHQKLQKQSSFSQAKMWEEEVA